MLYDIWAEWACTVREKVAHVRNYEISFNQWLERRGQNQEIASVSKRKRSYTFLRNPCR